MHAQCFNTLSAHWGAPVDFIETYTKVMNERNERAAESSKRARESDREAQALGQLIQVHRLDGCRIERPVSTTRHVVKGDESLQIVVDGPSLFTVERNRGRPFPSLKEASEDDIKRAVVQWLCPEVAEPNARRRKRPGAVFSGS